MKETYTIGIDLGGTFVKVGLIGNGQIIDCSAFESNMQNGLEVNLPGLKSTILDIIERNNVLVNELTGIGLAFPGIVDATNSKVLSTNEKYDDACRLNLEAWCEINFGVPFYIDNDARLAAIGEWKYGAAKGLNNVVMMTLGTGIGTGVILNGRVMYGEHFQAGSLGGHFVVDYKGRKCSCGNIGCVEAHASSFFLQRIIEESDNLSSAFKAESTDYTFEKLFCLSKENEEAQSLINECLNVWAAAIVTYIHAYDPQIVIVGGGIMKSENLILPFLRRYVDENAWCPTQKVEIVASELGDNAAVLAAEYCLINKIRKSESAKI